MHGNLAAIAGSLAAILLLGCERKAALANPPAAKNLSSPSIVSTKSPIAPGVLNLTADVAGHRAKFRKMVENLYRPVQKQDYIQVDFLKGGVLQPFSFVYVQTGDGHAGSIRSLCLQPTEEGIDVEEVEWQGQSLSHTEQPRGTVRRVRMSLSQCGPLLGMLRQLPLVKLREFKAGGPEHIGGDWTSTEDFFFNVQFIKQSGVPGVRKTHVGFLGSDSQLNCLPILVVLRVAAEVLPAKSQWKTVSQDNFRSCHFTSAFVRNRDVLSLPAYYWVLERSLDALGFFGNLGSLQALKTLGAKTTLLPEHKRKIDLLVGSPRHWLAGPPKLVGRE